MSLAVGEVERNVPLETSENTTCFLMGIRGAMQDSWHGANLVEENEEWVAHLRSGHTDEATRLSARFGCVDAQHIQAVEREVPGNSILACSAWDVANLLTLSPTDSAYCALSGVTGQFEGYQEYAEIVPHGPPALDPITQSPLPTKWYLRIGENRAFHTVRGHAACFVAPDSGLSPSQADDVAACSQRMEEGNESCCGG